MKVLNGIDRILEEDFGLGGKRLGLITNHSGLTGKMVSSIDILRKAFNLKALFAPEHGVRGDIQAGGKVETSLDKKSGLPVSSLYSEKGDHRPNQSMLKDIDILIMDIQDIGCRFYTYESTMYNAMEECAKLGKTFVVLDRVNPVNGVDVEGNILDPAYRSFVGIGPVCQRHGMTLGELALYYNSECKIACELKVVPVKGWNREMFGDEAGFLWVSPSPNMPGIDAALLYPGTCLFEGTSVSEGRGTTKPFEQIGAPWLDGEALAETMNARGHPGLIFRPAVFTPSFSKFAGEVCRGIQLHIRERRKIKPLAAALHLLEEIRAQAGNAFHWHRNSADRYFIDLLAGTDILRKAPVAEYRGLCEKDAAVFAEKRRPFLIYGDAGTPGRLLSCGLGTEGL